MIFIEKNLNILEIFLDLSGEEEYETKNMFMPEIFS